MNAEREHSEETLPALLKQAREKKGFSSLKEVEAATRIPVRYLEVLEGGGNRRFLADQVYLIPFLRSYATFLDIDPTLAVTRFITELQGVGAKGGMKSERVPLPTQSSSWTLPLLFLIPLLVIFVYIWQEEGSRLWKETQTTEDTLGPLPPPSDGKTSSDRMTEPTTFSPVTSPTVTETESSTPLPTTPSAPASIEPSPTLARPLSQSRTIVSTSQAESATTVSVPQMNLPAAETSHTLRVHARERTWIRVTIDNQQQKDVMLKPGETVEWQAQEGFTLTVGNAGGVTLSLDGEELPPLGKSGQVLRNFQLPSAG